jgi:hypothetical protein
MINHQRKFKTAKQLPRNKQAIKNKRHLLNLQRQLPGLRLLKKLRQK